MFVFCLVEINEFYLGIYFIKSLCRNFFIFLGRVISKLFSSSFPTRSVKNWNRLILALMFDQKAFNGSLRLICIYEVLARFKVLLVFVKNLIYVLIVRLWIHSHIIEKHKDRSLQENMSQNHFLIYKNIKRTKGRIYALSAAARLKKKRGTDRQQPEACMHAQRPLNQIK